MNGERARLASDLESLQTRLWRIAYVESFRGVEGWFESLSIGAGRLDLILDPVDAGHEYCRKSQIRIA